MALSDTDMHLLAELEQTPQPVSRGQTLWKAEDVPRTLYTLRRGWAYSMHRSESGEGQVLDIFLPGDLMGIRELTLPAHSTDVVMLTSGVVCPFPAERLLDIFQHSPSLTLAIHAAAARQQVIISKRLVNILRHDARARIAHFVLELYYRLKRVDESVHRDFSVPLLQSDFGKLLGMTKVHVSRTLGEMENQGLLRKTRKDIQILDLERLLEISAFDPVKLTDQLNPTLTAALFPSAPT
ncbi:MULTISPECIES: Crp/Fnr family transcriptional regulator [unclassified Modicisalibacter]|uniref:Crp/Fnr family transcriptional regulator n=1 Tax=unclassified Modicisalibacter TaxID=2679913 RepID=UPI001CCB82A7|nr:MULTISPECIES: Crp/Fnr family transcriptional regulator [unclassified Modicisalibacter]MBZ9559945.1 Crp/Fnr family transcriptional regulator [Modicisalibacter sp. R2A 31.J]MBZ9575853.1 Crp/Fnr family transcriptional regulator [Modicisalibacter sp. MOD 31.J]